MSTKSARRCKCGCGKDISNKHPNAKFFNQKHKDAFWNLVNPRGKFEHLNLRSPNFDPERDRHPFDLED